MDGRKNNAISIEKRVAGTSRRYVGRIDGVAGEAELHFTVRGQRRSAPTAMSHLARRGSLPASLPLDLFTRPAEISLLATLCAAPPLSVGKAARQRGWGPHEKPAALPMG